MSILARNHLPLSTNTIPCVVPRDGHLHSRRLSASTPRPWDFVDKSEYLELAIACTSSLKDGGDKSRMISFPKLNNDDEQIKQLEFLLGELKIDMEIMFERKCLTPNLASVGTMATIETKEATTQTDQIAESKSECSSVCDTTFDECFDENVFETEIRNQSHQDEIQRIEQHYETEISHLIQESNKWQRENSSHKQTIASLCDEIEQKNQLLTAAKVFIDEHVKNTTENAVVRKNDDDDDEHDDDIDGNGVSHVECQQCTFSSNLLTQTQFEKDKLNMENSRLKEIISTYKTELQTLDGKLQQNIAKNVHCEKALDIARSLESQLVAENHSLQQEADDIKSKLAALESDNHCLAIELAKRGNGSLNMKGCSKLLKHPDGVKSSTVSKKKEFAKPNENQAFDKRPEIKMFTKAPDKTSEGPRKTKDEDRRIDSRAKSQSNTKKRCCDQVPKEVTETKILKLEKTKVEPIRSSLESVKKQRESTLKSVNNKVKMRENQRLDKQMNGILCKSASKKTSISTKSQTDGKVTSSKNARTAKPEPKSMPPNKQHQPRQKLDRKTSMRNILIRVVHEEEKNHRKTFRKVGIENPDDVTAVARAKRIEHLSRLIIIERKSIDSIAVDDLRFLYENFNDPTLYKTLATCVSQNDLLERLQQAECLATQMHKSKETAKKWCNVL